MANNLIDRGWNRKVKLTINKNFVDADQTDFPIMLLWNGTSGNLPPEVYNGSSTSPKSDGRDIRFSADYDGSIELPFETLTYSPNITISNARVEIHTKLPTLFSATDTTFYMWWGNEVATAYQNTDTYGRNNVWTNGFLGVFHLDETSGSTAVNSVGGPDGTYAGTSFPNWIDSSIGGCQNFSNLNDRINLQSGSPWNITGNIALSAIVAVPSFLISWMAVIAKGDQAYRLHMWDGSYIASFAREFIEGGHFDASANIDVVTDGNFHHLLGTFNTSIGSYMYTDSTASPLNSSTSLTATSSDLLCIGRNTDYTNTRDWNGYISKVRICNTSRSAAWAKAEYHNLIDPFNFTSADYAGNVDFSEIGCNF